MKSTAKYIDTLIADFNKMDLIEKDRIKGIITECYEMSKKSPRELLATGLYSVEEIEALFPEKLKEDYYIFFQVELEHVFSDINTYLNSYKCMQILGESNGEQFFIQFNNGCAAYKIHILTELKHKTDLTLSGYIKEGKNRDCILSQLKSIRDAFDSNTVEEMAVTIQKTVKMCSDAPLEYRGIRFEKYSEHSERNVSNFLKLVKEHIPRGDSFDHDCSYNPEKACEAILSTFCYVADKSTTCYFKHLEGLKIFKQRNFLRYIGKRLQIQQGGDIENLHKTGQLNQETVDAINTPHKDYTEYKI